MSNIKERQLTDSKQGGEGTNSFHNKSYDFLSTSEFKTGQSQEPNRIGSKEGTK